MLRIARIFLKSDIGLNLRIEKMRSRLAIAPASSAIRKDAYLTTHTCDTWEQVERYCREYDGVTVV